LRRTDFFLELHFDRASAGPYHARAMGNPLRDRRTPLEFAASRQVIDFSIKISDFEQLERIVEDDLEMLDPDKIPPDWRESVINGQLRFGFADARNGLPMVRGEIHGTLDAVCQRCLEPMQLPLSVELNLLFAGDGSATADEAGLEVWELEEETLRLHDLVEETLVMAMPIAAMHENEKCHGPELAGAGAGDKIRPFAALKAQMENEN
jgi:uncharacterized metal-binding protein YceD (DUF177 family)